MAKEYYFITCDVSNDMSSIYRFIIKSFWIKLRNMRKMVQTCTKYDFAMRYFLNRMVNTEIIPTVVDLQYHLEKEQINLAKAVKNYESNSNSFLDDVEVDGLYRRVADAEEEYEDCKKLVYLNSLLVSPNVRRWVFRSGRNKKLVVNTVNFVSIYNEWTIRSAEYLITEKRREHDASKFQIIIETTTDVEKKKRLVEAMEQVDAEYAQKLKLQKELLVAYIYDIYAILKSIDEEFGQVIMETVAYQKENGSLKRSGRLVIAAEPPMPKVKKKRYAKK